MKCRSCSHSMEKPFLSLGMSPLSNAFLNSQQIGKMEAFFPLETFVCEKCWLVQLDAFEAPEQIFSDYVYFSSYSPSWLKHAENYCNKMTEQFKLNAQSTVVEIASNDGYLLQYFVKKGIRVLGVEPAANVAAVAIKERSVPSISEFFGEKLGKKLAQDGYGADLMAANNVLAHVPDINDFVEGFRQLLKPTGVATFEFPHLVQMMKHNQFDTIYHEHFSYLSLLALEPLFARHDLEIFDVEEIPTHGGSLRVFVKHRGNGNLKRTEQVAKVLKAERDFGLADRQIYQNFNEKVIEVKRSLLQFLIQAKREGKKVVGYGAAAKGNTLLNFCGVREDFVDFVSDKNPHKQNKFLPGVHIPVKDVTSLFQAKPDYVIILPWNLKKEIESELVEIRKWGGKFVVAIPTLEVF